VPFVNPVNVYAVAVEPVLTGVQDPEGFMLYSTTYPVIGVPPLLVGAVHVKETCALPGVPVKFVGLLGVVKVVPITMSLYVPVPTIFTAATRISYVVLLANPVTMVFVVPIPVIGVKTLPEPVTRYCKI
jgi:hypothetical protein